MPEHRNEMLERVVRRAVQGAREGMVGIRITDCVVTIVSSDAVDAVLPLEGEQPKSSDLAPEPRTIAPCATCGHSRYAHQRLACDATTDDGACACDRWIGLPD